VNQELHILTDVIPRLIPLLDEGGRLAIISFHSLEDRIIKVAFKEAALREEVLLLTKKPIGPTEDEIKNNFRSRSAKLRVIEKR
jgi:16S rRNA (cytosine1402-N4)-methyltransferase